MALLQSLFLYDFQFLRGRQQQLLRRVIQRRRRIVGSHVSTSMPFRVDGSAAVVGIQTQCRDGGMVAEVISYGIVSVEAVEMVWWV